MNYIYILIDPRTNEVRYVGKSINPRVRVRKHISEAKNLKSNNHRINWIKGLLVENFKPKMEILDEIEGDWGWLEEYWISQFKTWGYYLVNSTDGGENPPSIGRRITDKEKENLRERMSGDSNPAKGGLTDEWKKNIRDSLVLINHLPKISKLAAEVNKQPVIQLTKNGEFIKEWSSMVDAAKGIGLKAPSTISMCILGKRKTTGGYKWIKKNG